MVMLNVKRQRRLTASFYSLAQAWHSEAGRERGAEADFIDETQRASFAGDAPRRNASEMMIAMAFKDFGKFTALAVRRFGHKGTE